MEKTKRSKLKAIIFLLILVAAVIGYFVHRNTQAVNRELTSAAEKLLDSADRENRGKVINLYDGEYGVFYKYKDSKKLGKILVKLVNEKIAERNEKYADEYMIYRSDFDREFAEAVVRFDEIGLHDEDLDQVMTDFLKAEKDELMSDYEHVEVVAELALYIKSANSDFYLKNVFTDSELADYFSGCISYSLENHDAETLSKGLAAAHALELTKQCVPDEEALYNELIESFEVYMTTGADGSFFSKGRAYSQAYHENYGAEGMESIGYHTKSTSETTHGDFSLRVTRESSYVEGLVDDASRNEYNYRRESEGSAYLRGLRAVGVSQNILENRSLNYVVGEIKEDRFYGIFALGNDEVTPCMGILGIEPADFEFYDLSKYLKDNAQAPSSNPTSLRLNDWNDIIKYEDIPSNSGMEYINTVFNVGTEGDYSSLVNQAKERFNKTTNCETIINSALSELKDGDSEKAEESLTIFLENAGWQEYLKYRAIALIGEEDSDTALKINDMLAEHDAKSELTDEILSAYETAQSESAAANDNETDGTDINENAATEST